MKTLATIGYEQATVRSFLDTLKDAGVELVVDVRAVASSRKPGFAKTRLAANLESVGIEYLHLRGLGTPADGRAAARAGRPEEMHAIYREHLETPEAQRDLETLVDLVRAGRAVCLLCLEADARACHRSLVAAAVDERTRVKVVDLDPAEE